MNGNEKGIKMAQSASVKNKNQQPNIFLAQDGSLINASLVTHITKNKTQEGLLVRFTFVNTNARELIFKDEKGADDQIKGFLEYVGQPELFELFTKHF